MEVIRIWIQEFFKDSSALQDRAFSHILLTSSDSGSRPDLPWQMQMLVFMLSLCGLCCTLSCTLYKGKFTVFQLTFHTALLVQQAKNCSCVFIIDKLFKQHNLFIMSILHNNLLDNCLYTHHKHIHGRSSSNNKKHSIIHSTD